MTESPYERIDRMQTVAFAGLMIAGLSPIIGDVLSGWFGWPLFIAGAGTFAYGLIRMQP